MFEGIIIYLFVVFFFAIWQTYFYIFKNVNNSYKSCKLLIHMLFMTYGLALFFVIRRILLPHICQHKSPNVVPWLLCF